MLSSHIGHKLIVGMERELRIPLASEFDMQYPPALSAYVEEGVVHWCSELSPVVQRLYRCIPVFVPRRHDCVHDDGMLHIRCAPQEGAPGASEGARGVYVGAVGPRYDPYRDHVPGSCAGCRLRNARTHGTRINARPCMTSIGRSCQQCTGCISFIFAHLLGAAVE